MIKTDRGAVMDIFTTALTRVVPVPIKPASLKVKALTKEAATSDVTDDIDGLEHHEMYFKKSNDKTNDERETDDESAGEQIKAAPVPSDNTGQTIDIFDDSDQESANAKKANKDSPPHLDIYV
jgi:hypothetical protein